MLATLQAMLREAPVLMAALDGDLVCRELSPAWRDLLGVGREAPVTLPGAELFDAVDQVRITARIRFTVTDGRAVRGLMATLNTANRPVPARLWAWRFGEGTEVWTLVSAFETVRGQTSADGSRMHGVHQQLLEAAGEGICGVDDLGRATFLNARAAEILGGATEEILGQPMHDVIHHSKADGSPNPRETSPIRAAYKEGVSAQVDDDVFWRPDGGAVPVEYTCTPIWHKDKVSGAVIVFRDSSHTRQLASEQQAARSEIEQLRGELEIERTHVREQVQRAGPATEELVVESRAMRRALEQMEAIAATDRNVLVLGEPGTGKESLAAALHARSARHARPLVVVKCARGGGNLEAELFGDDAAGTSPGRWQLASGATLLLDEVGELPKRVQTRLLEALRTSETDAAQAAQPPAPRIIATSSRDLETDARAGRFVEELFDLLAVFSLRVPALRERPEDVAPLTRHFLAGISAELGRQAPRVTRQQLLQLTGQTWAGNVRELRSVIEHAAILSRGERLRLDLALPAASPAVEGPAAPLPIPAQIRTDAEIREVERVNMLAALRYCRGRVSGPDGAARLLGLKPSTLAYRMKNFGIDRDGIRDARAAAGDYAPNERLEAPLPR